VPLRGAVVDFVPDRLGPDLQRLRRLRGDRSGDSDVRLLAENRSPSPRKYGAAVLHMLSRMAGWLSRSAASPDDRLNELLLWAPRFSASDHTLLAHRRYRRARRVSARADVTTTSPTKRAFSRPFVRAGASGCSPATKPRPTRRPACSHQVREVFGVSRYGQPRDLLTARGLAYIGVGSLRPYPAGQR